MQYMSSIHLHSLDTNANSSTYRSAGQSSDSSPDDVFKSPYWRRIWIIQEFAAPAANNLQVIHRDSEIDAESLMWRKLEESKRPKGDIRAAIDSSGVVQDIRHSYIKFHDWTLLDLLVSTKSSLCSKRHDRVFGILALAKDARAFLHEPSYEISETQQSLLMTQAYLHSATCKLDIILLGPRFREQGQIPELPSWCPNYFRFDELRGDEQLLDYVVLVTERSRSPDAHSATGKSKVDISKSDGTCLRSRAIRLGMIESLGWIPSDDNTEKFPTSVPDSHDSSYKVDDAATAMWNLCCPKIFRKSKLRTCEGRLLTAAHLYFLARVFTLSHLVGDTEDGSGWFGKWLDANRLFLFQNKTLQQHGRNTRTRLGERQFWCATFAKAPDPPYFPRGWEVSDQMNLILFSLWRRGISQCKTLYKPLKDVAKQNRRLMSLRLLDRESVIGLANPDARLSDEVFLIPGCSMPVILRPQPDGQRYEVVGEAVIPGAMDGEIWHDRDNCKFTDVEIV